MSININRINQNTNYNLNSQQNDLNFSGLLMREVTQGTGNVGKLIPIFCRELMPNQKININYKSGLQFNPFVTNLLHEFKGQLMTYFVPYRLIWDEWENFITGGKDGNFTTELPNINKDGYKIEKGSILDYIGYPLETLRASDEIKLSSFPRTVYNFIWNEQIRNLDIQEKVTLDNDKLLNSHWDYDYFNRARIAQIRGTLSTIPITADEATEIEQRFDFGYWGKTVDGKDTFVSNKNNYYTKLTNANGWTDYAVINGNDMQKDTLKAYGTEANSDSTKALRIAPIKTKEIMKGAGINLNDLMKAIAITKYQVNNIRTKPRYMEQLKMRFGVSPTDERLQLPEYIKTSTINITTNTVTQTAPSATGSNTGVGSIIGQAWGYDNNSVSYFAQEWGILMTLMVIKPAIVYEQGAPKMWTKKDKFDFATPELENILDVPIYRSELNYAEKNRTKKNNIFGWTGIYDDYRTTTNKVVSDLRPSLKESLKTYTLANKLSENVALNAEFIECRPDMARVKQFINQDDFIFYSESTINTAIPLVLQSQPESLLIK